jgi:serine/threonine protein phosphatase PrpC
MRKCLEEFGLHLLKEWSRLVETTLSDKKYTITFESKTFIVPLKARSRAICWQEVHKDSESGLGAVFAVVETISENIRACEVSCDIIRESFKSFYFEDGYYVFDENEKIEDKIKNVFEEVNRSLFSVGSRENVDMRVSMLLGITRHDTLYLGHSGGGRGILLRNHRIHQITSRQKAFRVIAEQDTVSVQKDAEKELRERNRLLLGNRQMPSVDIHKVVMKHDDVLLFFTDSVTETVADNEILSFFLKAEDSLYPLSRIITLATDRGGYRDIMLAGIKFQESREVMSIDEATTADLGALEDLISAEADKDEVIHHVSTVQRKPLSKPAVFLFSLLLTLLLGFLYLTHMSEKLQEAPMTVTVRSASPLKDMAWMGKGVYMQNGTASFEARPRDAAALFFDPEKEQYNCHIIIISKDKPRIITEPSMVGIQKNTLMLTHRQIMVKANIFSVVEPPQPEYEETEIDGVGRFRVEFVMRNLKGPFEMVSDGRSKVEDVKVEVKSFN